MPKVIEIEEVDLLRLQLAESQAQASNLNLQMARKAIEHKYGAQDGDMYTVKREAPKPVSVPEESAG